MLAFAALQQGTGTGLRFPFAAGMHLPRCSCGTERRPGRLSMWVPSLLAYARSCCAANAGRAAADATIFTPVRWLPSWGGRRGVHLDERYALQPLQQSILPSLNNDLQVDRQRGVHPDERAGGAARHRRPRHGLSDVRRLLRWRHSKVSVAVHREEPVMGGGRLSLVCDDCFDGETAN